MGCLTLRLIQFLDLGTVAIGAGLWRRRIEEDLLTINSLEKLVAARALYVPVLTLQSESRALVVIE